MPKDTRSGTSPFWSAAAKPARRRQAAVFTVESLSSNRTLECEYATKLLAEILDKNIEGDIVEFGIYQGWWINFLYRTTEELGLDRRIYGFDSFEGLSDPHPEHDQAYWKKGQYANTLAR